MTDENQENNIEGSEIKKFQDGDNESIVTPNLEEYKVEKPSFMSWLVIFGIALLSNLVWKLFVPISIVTLFILLLAISFIGIIFWSFIGKFIATRLLIYPITKLAEANKNKRPNSKISKVNFILRSIFLLIGIKINKDYNYYLERQAYHTSVSNLKEFLFHKLVDTISSSLGLSFLIITAVKPFLENWNEAMMISLVIFLMSPLLTGLIIPTFWIIYDTRIKYIKPDNDIRSLGDDVRRGFLNKFLGFSGFLAAINFLLDVLPSHPALSRFTGHTLSNLIFFLISLLILLLIIVFILGINVFTAAFYLSYYHSKKVNEFRKRLSEIVPIADTEVIKE